MKGGYQPDMSRIFPNPNKGMMWSGMSVPDWPPENIDELAKKYEDPFNK